MNRQKTATVEALPVATYEALNLQIDRSALKDNKMRQYFENHIISLLKSQYPELRNLKCRLSKSRYNKISIRAKVKVPELEKTRYLRAQAYNLHVCYDRFIADYQLKVVNCY
jgi:hypothetical protein